MSIFRQRRDHLANIGKEIDANRAEMQKGLDVMRRAEALETTYASTADHIPSYGNRSVRDIGLTALEPMALGRLAEVQGQGVRVVRPRFPLPETRIDPVDYAFEIRQTAS